MDKKPYVRLVPPLLALLSVVSPTALAGVLSVPASALLPRDNTIAYDTNGVRMAVPDVGERVFVAPVFIPDGAAITKFVLEARDSSGGEFGGHIKAELAELRFNTALPIATLDTGIPDDPGETRVEQLLNFHIDNAEYGYGISVTINNGSGGAWNQLFYKVIIHYRFSCPGDFDLDGDVDGSDLAIFSQNFGRIDCL